MTRFFLAQLRDDFRCYPATAIVDDVLCGLWAVLFVGAVCGLLIGFFGGG